MPEGTQHRDRWSARDWITNPVQRAYVGVAAAVIGVALIGDPQTDLLGTLLIFAFLPLAGSAIIEVAGA